MALPQVSTISWTMAFTGMNSGEKPFLFLVGFLVLLFAGAGKYSFDKK